MKNDNLKSNVEHWNENWQHASANVFSSDSSTSESFIWGRLKAPISKALSRTGISQGKLIEIGAGGSEFLPLFNKTFGFSVAGLDYSEVGCLRTKEILASNDIAGDVYFADMFAPPVELLSKFDVVVSLGLVEHFEDTKSAIKACASFARPGGLIITSIPNMAGLHGWLYRIYDRKVYDMHVPLSLRELSYAHVEAGLNVMFAEHLFGLPGVFDGGRRERSVVRRMFRWVGHLITKGHWYLEEHGLGVPENRISSPLLICIAKKEE